MGGQSGSRRARAGGSGAPGAGEGTGRLGSGVLNGDQDPGAQAALSASNTSEVKPDAAARKPQAPTPPGHPSHSPGASRPRRGREAVSPCNRELASPPPQRVWDPWRTAQSHSAGGLEKPRARRRPVSTTESARGAAGWVGRIPRCPQGGHREDDGEAEGGEASVQTAVVPWGSIRREG